MTTIDSRPAVPGDGRRLNTVREPARRAPRALPRQACGRRHDTPGLVQRRQSHGSRLRDVRARHLSRPRSRGRREPLLPFPPLRRGPARPQRNDRGLDAAGKTLVLLIKKSAPTSSHCSCCATTLASRTRATSQTAMSSHAATISPSRRANRLQRRPLTRAVRATEPGCVPTDRRPPA